MFIEGREFYLDELTGAKNRRYLNTFIKKEIKKCKRYNQVFSILLLDLDDFKVINDIHGHLEGDKVLKGFVDFLQRTLRESDEIIRYGGDEFIVFLPNTDREHTVIVAQRILNKIKSVKIEGYKIGVSIGVAGFPRDGKSWDEIFRKADHSLYVAKRKGKGQVSIPEEEEVLPVIPAKMFVGRTEDRKWLLEALKRGDKLYLIRGSAGIGKTRLVKETYENLDNIIFLRGAVHSALSSIPFVPFREILAYFYNNHRIFFKEILVSLTDSEKKVLSRLFPRLNEESEGIEFDRFKLFDTLRKIFDIVSSRKKLVIFIDDLQWADRSTLELFYYLLRNSGENTVFCAAYRYEEIHHTDLDEFLTLISRERIFEERKLSPMDYRGTKELVDAILTMPADENVYEFLYNKSGGNPFFVEELIKELYNKGLLYFKNTWQLKKEVEGFQIPSSIEDVINRRIGELREAPVLEIAACMGHEFNVKLIQDAFEIDIGEVYDRMDKGIKLGIIQEEGDDVFSFKEDIIRELLIERIPESKKKYYHSRILKSLERMAPRVEGSTELLAYHAYMAGDKNKIREYALQAARNSKRIFAYKEALKFYEWYIQYEDEGEKKCKASLEMADIFVLLGELKKALEYVKGLRKECVKYLPGEYYYSLSKIYDEIGEYEKALDMVNKALEYAEEEREYEYILLKGWIMNLLGRTDEAKMLLEPLLKNKEHLDKVNLGTLYNILGDLERQLGESESAFKYFDEAIKIRKEIQDIKGVGTVCINRALLYDNLGKFEEALEEYRKAQQAFEEVGYKAGAILLHIDLGVLFATTRKLIEALSEFKKAYKIASEIGQKKGMLLALYNISWCLQYIERWKEAEEFTRKALEIADETGDIEGKILAINYLSLIYQCGYSDLNTAESYFNEALGLLEKTEDQNVVVRVYERGASLYHEKGDYHLALRYAEIAMEIIERLNYDFYKIPAYFMLARILSKLGDSKSSFKYLKKAKNVAREMGESDGLEYKEWLAEYLKDMGKKKGAVKVLKSLKEYYLSRGLKVFAELAQKEIDKIQKGQ